MLVAENKRPRMHDFLPNNGVFISHFQSKSHIQDLAWILFSVGSSD